MMSDPSTRYRSGHEIRAGDRITLAGRTGQVVFILSRETEPFDWFKTQYGSGFMLDVEGMGNIFQRESDEDLELVGRASQPT